MHPHFLEYVKQSNNGIYCLVRYTNIYDNFIDTKHLALSSEEEVKKYFEEFYPYLTIVEITVKYV